YRGYASTVPTAERLREPAVWLREHAAEGDLVFHAHWDQFASLFFWNARCRYVNGHDPVFLYDFDPRLSWVVHELETDGVLVKDGRAFAEDDPRPGQGRSKPAVDWIADDFGARWVLLQKQRTPKLLACLRGEPKLELALETVGEVVFRVRS